DYYGPLADARLLEVPEYLLSSVIITQSEEGFSHAVEGWKKFGTCDVVDAAYSYIVQTRRGLLDRQALLYKILDILPKAGELDILALQRVLKLGLGITTCDLGIVMLAYVPLPNSPPPPRPVGTIYELRRHSTIYVARNGQGPPVYDFETMCVIPIGGREPFHPLYGAYLGGYKILTEKIPTERDLCVVHKKLGLQCIYIENL
ncbi:MAG: hypothetical protein ACK4M3_08145, partial [Pyrobaculum sp.]